MLRKFLDGLYLLGGVIAACFLIALLVLIVLQMLARWTGELFPGAADYAGYCMAGASFFAFAYTLNHNAHIRVSILLNALGSRRRWGEIWCFVSGAVISTYFAWFAVKGTYWSHKLGDMSQGLDATPIWIPQLAMSAGTILLAICFWDNLFQLIRGRDHLMRSEVVEGAN